MTTISNLPFSILQRIFFYIPDTAHYECRQVCKSWANIFQNTKATKKLLKQKQLGLIRMTIQARDKNMIHDCLVKSYGLKFKNFKTGRTLKIVNHLKSINCYEVSCRSLTDISNFGIQMKLSGSTKLYNDDEDDRFPTQKVKFEKSESIIQMEQLGQFISVLKIDGEISELFVDQDFVFLKALKVESWYKSAIKLKLRAHLPIPEDPKIMFTFLKSSKPESFKNLKNSTNRTGFSNSLVCSTITFQNGRCNTNGVILEHNNLSGEFGGIHHLIRKNCYLVHVKKVFIGKISLMRVLLGEIIETTENTRIEFDKSFKMALKVKSDNEIVFWFGEYADESGYYHLYDYEVSGI